MEHHTLSIDEKENLYLDEMKLRNVEKYILSHSATEEAEVTITMAVKVGTVGKEIISQEEIINYC